MTLTFMILTLDLDDLWLNLAYNISRRTVNTHRLPTTVAGDGPGAFPSCPWWLRLLDGGLVEPGARVLLELAAMELDKEAWRVLVVGPLALQEALQHCRLVHVCIVRVSFRVLVQPDSRVLFEARWKHSSIAESGPEDQLLPPTRQPSPALPSSFLSSSRPQIWTGYTSCRL